MKWNETAQKLSYKSKVFFKKNGSTILTCAGAVGLVATAVSAAKATPKVVKLIEANESEKGSELTTMEKVQIAAPHYIPTVLIGAGSIACMFGANVLNKRQQASITSAYALLDGSFKDYKNKIEELYGEGASMRVREEIAKDKYEEEPILIEGDGKQLFYDDWSGRYFEATLADVIQAEANLNKQIHSICDGAYLNEWYEFLGLEPTIEGKEMGWSTGILSSMYWATWVDFSHETVTMDDGLECVIIVMHQKPVIDFAYY